MPPPPADKRPAQFSLRWLLAVATFLPPVIGGLVYLIREFPDEAAFLFVVIMTAAGFGVMVIGMVASAALLCYVIYVMPIKIALVLINHYQQGRLKRRV